MKNFLKLLLVGTILVSATDGYSSQRAMKYWRDDKKTGSNSNAGSSTTATAGSSGGTWGVYANRITGDAGEMLRTNPVTLSFGGEFKYNGNVLAYWKDDKWLITDAGRAAGFKTNTAGKLDFSAPKNLTISGNGGNTFNLGSGTSVLEIENAGLLNGTYTINNVRTPSGIVLNGQYEVTNLGNGQLEFKSLNGGGATFIRDVKKDGWTITQGNVEIRDYGNGTFEVYKNKQRIYVADNTGDGRDGLLPDEVKDLEIDGQKYQVGKNPKNDRMNVLEPTGEPAPKTTTPTTTEDPELEDLFEDTEGERYLNPDEAPQEYHAPGDGSNNPETPAVEQPVEVDPDAQINEEIDAIFESEKEELPSMPDSEGPSYEYAGEGEGTNEDLDALFDDGGRDVNQEIDERWTPDDDPSYAKTELTDADGDPIYVDLDTGELVNIEGYKWIDPDALTTSPQFSAKLLGVTDGKATIEMYGMQYEMDASLLPEGYTVGGELKLSSGALDGLTHSVSGFSLGNFGATFGNYFDSLLGTVTGPLKLIGGLLTKPLETLKGMWDGLMAGLEAVPGNFGSIFTGGMRGQEILNALMGEQAKAATELTAAEQAALAAKLATFPIRIWNPGEYTIQIMQTVEAGNQDKTTKQVKVKAENGLLDSQGAPTDSTVGDVSLKGTNLASAASQMAVLLEYNPVDLNLLKMDDLDLSKDRDQKTLRQRRDLLLQMYATSAQIIAEGSNDISEKFYERISLLSESLPETTGSLGSASVLNDSERYPYFEMIRQTALSATQLGLKGADILPNLRIAAPKSDEQ